MAEHEPPFTAEHVEAQLAEREQRLAAHRQPENAPADLRLIADLRDLYRPAPDLAQRLERVWGRVERRVEESRRAAEPRRRSSGPLVLQAARTERQRAMRASLLNWRERHFSRVGSLVAAVAVLVIVSGLIAGLVLVRQYGSPAANKNLTGGLEVVLQTSCGLNDHCTPDHLNMTSKLLVQRIRDGLGITEGADVHPQGYNQILLRLPPFQGDQTLVAQLVQVGNVFFLNTGAVQGLPNQPLPSGGYEEIFGGTDIDPSSVQATIDTQTGQPVLLFQFEVGAQGLFALYTRDHIGDYLTIILDGNVLESLLIQGEITGPLKISGGNMTLASAKVLAAILRSGPLPLTLSIVREQRIGSTTPLIPTPTQALPTQGVPTLTPTPAAASGYGFPSTSLHMVNAAHWRQLRPSSNFQNVTSLDFVSSTTGWAINGPDGLLLKTTDGGQTWSVITLTR